ncbi:antichymotrypsin-2-like isoform X2 [Anopheles darlingi]|uniref:antichymotrypsin-2-like isoform X2 n=1 Tax=Anopheles darlingi TaxID=43151 RepID=UPI002100659F|nr:antichymotrypsin-2-like isoform X2 [Anopheles darlingi]
MCMMGPFAKRMFQLLIIAFVILQTYQDEVHAKDFTEFVKQSNNFAIQLYRQVNAKRNVVISPFSISACLSLIAMGADGDTVDEIFRVLRYWKPDPRQQVAETYARLNKVLENDKTTTVANKVYVKAGYEVQPSFNDVAIRSFQSETQELNFTDNVAAANTINDWVALKTKKKIKDFISPSALDGVTGIVLINAVHFMGSWMYQLDQSNNFSLPFWISTTESRNIPMMTFYAYKNFADKGFSSIEIPYKNSSASMLVLLPNDRDPLEALEKQFSSLVEDTSQMLEKKIRVFLPKFKTKFSIDVQDDLTALGMERMFSHYADFSNLFETGERLKVSKVIHRGFMKVDEKGTEAAAASIVELVLTSSKQPSKSKADYPFVYGMLP